MYFRVTSSIQVEFNWRWKDPYTSRLQNEVNHLACKGLLQGRFLHFQSETVFLFADSLSIALCAWSVTWINTRSRSYFQRRPWLLKFILVSIFTSSGYFVFESLCTLPMTLFCVLFLKWTFSPRVTVMSNDLKWFMMMLFGTCL